MQAYDALVLAASGRDALDIVTARPLDQADLDSMVGDLKKRYGKNFQVTTSVDPSLLGGVGYDGRSSDRQLPLRPYRRPRARTARDLRITELTRTSEKACDD